MKDSFDITPPDEEDNHQTILFLNTLPRIGKFVKPEQQSELPDTHDPVLKGKLDITSSDQDEILKQMIRQNTNLMRAVEAGNLTSVERSILEGAQINAHCGAFHITALHLAAYLGYTHILSYLLQNGANANAEDKMGRTGIYLAATTGSKECMQLLINAKADINRKVHVPTTRKSPRATWPGDMEENTFQPYALEFAKIAIGSNLLPFPDCLGRAPLHQAVKGGHSECVQILLNAGANVNEEDDKYLTPLLLAGAGVVPEDKGAVQRYEEIVKLLVQEGADVNVYNLDTTISALHHAVALKSLKATRCLLDAGADISLKGHNNITALHEASGLGCSVIVNELLMRGHWLTMVNCPDSFGRTPLHKAAYGGHSDCLKTLLDHGGDLSAETQSGVSVVDAIFSHIARPQNFLLSILDSKITPNDESANDRLFKVTLDFKMLAPHGPVNQMSVMRALLNSDGDTLIRLLQHPLIETFLCLKWRKMRSFFIILVALYISFVLSLSNFIFLVHCEFKTRSANGTQEQYIDEGTIDVAIEVTRVILYISASVILSYILGQIAFLPRYYLRDFETWMNFTCGVISIVIAVKSYRRNLLSWIPHVTAIAVLFAWTELMLLIGRFPTWGYYALMFSTVLKNVLKVLLTFICLIIGFSMSFFVLFITEEQFSDPWKSLVKTLVLTMGEFEYDSTFEADKNRVRVTSRIVFLTFVVLASIALMNLMVGLAVSDIQELQTVGHVKRLMKQTDFISHLEKITSHRIISAILPRKLRTFVDRHSCIPTEVVIQPGLAEPHGDQPFKLAPDLLDKVITGAVKMQMSKVTYLSKVKLDTKEERIKVLDEIVEEAFSANPLSTNEKNDQLVALFKKIVQDLDGIKDILETPQRKCSI